MSDQRSREAPGARAERSGSALAPGRDDPPHRFSSVATETLSRKITRAIIGSIIQGHYRPGELLPTEEELSEQLGVSRPVVREATKSVYVEMRRRLGDKVMDLAEAAIKDCQTQ